MQVLKDTFNGLMGRPRRQLDTLWLDIQTRKQTNQLHTPSFLNFLASFIRQLHSQQPISAVFSHRDDLLAELVGVIGQGLCATLEDHRVVIQALLFVFIDMVQSEPSLGSKYMRDLLSACHELCLCVQRESDCHKMRQTLQLVQFLFGKVDGLKSQSVQEGYFSIFLHCIDSKNEECQELLLNFFEVELVTSESEKEQNRWSLLQADGLVKNDLTFKNLLFNVKDKLLNQIPGEYEQQLNAERASDRLSQTQLEKQERFSEPHPFQRASNLTTDEPLPSDFIQQIKEERGDSQTRSSLPPSQLTEQNQVILTQLRQGSFMAGVQERISSCSDDKLQVYTMLAYILNCFSVTHWAESEKNLLPTLKTRFCSATEASESIVKLFQEILKTVVTNGSPDSKKIRNMHMYLFLQECTRECQPRVRDALCLEFKSFLAANRFNPAIFVKEKGFDWLKTIPLSESVIDLARYLLHVLANLHSECQEYLMFLARQQLDHLSHESKYVYRLLERYFLKTNLASQDLFTQSIQLYQNDEANAKSLLAACCKHYLSQSDQIHFPDAFQVESHALKLSASDDHIDCYLAAELVKSLLQSKSNFNCLSIIQRVPDRLKLNLARLLFVPRNNPYAHVLKESFVLRPESVAQNLLSAEWHLFREALAVQNMHKALAHLNYLTVLVSGSSAAKQTLDEKIREAGYELKDQFAIDAFSSEKQGELVECLLELCTDCLHDHSNSIVWDYMAKAESRQFSEFMESIASASQASATQVFFREIDYSFYLHLFGGLSAENLITLLHKIKEFASCHRNKQTLIKANFQTFIMGQLEKKHPLTLNQNKQVYFRQENLALFCELLKQGIVPMPVQDLLKPSLLQIVTQVLSQNPAPTHYASGQMSIQTNSIRLKQDTAISDANVLFRTSTGQTVVLSRDEVVQNPEEGAYNHSLQWTYSLRVDDSSAFLMDLWIDLGIYDLGGWNHYEVSLPEGELVVNGNRTTLRVRGSIQHASDVLYEVSEPAVKTELTLKELMSSQETILLLVQMIHKARGDDSIISLFKVIAALVTKNPTKLSFDIENLIQVKMIEIHADRILDILKSLVDLALDQVGGHLRVELQGDQLCEQLIPRLVHPEKLALPMKLLAQVPAEEGSQLIELISLLLIDQQNLVTFHQSFGIEPILRILTSIRDSVRKQPLYDRTLRLYELFIDGVRLNHLPIGVLQTVFDFLLGLALVPETKPVTKRIVIDCLAVIMIHLIVDETHELLPKIFELNIVDFIYRLLQSNIEEVREYCFKIICLLMTQGPQHKVKFSFDFETITELLQMQSQSMNLCTAVLDASTGRFTNVNDLCPSDDALVIQMMNLSRSAQKIVSQIKQSFSFQRRTSIVYPEMLDCFFAALSRVQNDVSRHMCLKQFATMQFDHNNIENVFDQGGLQRLIGNIFTLQLQVIQSEDVSNTAKKFYENYLFDRFAQINTYAGGYSTTEDDPLGNSGSKSGSGLANPEVQFPTRTLDAVLELLTQIVVKDLHRPFFQTEVYNIMLTHPYNDDRLQLQIISRILRHFHRSPKLDDKNILVNLCKIFANMEKLMAENAAISLKVINLINLIAFKSSTETRKLMKENKLLELRDKLMVDQIRKTYQQSTNEYLVTALSKFSFDAIASKPIFSQNCCTEYLVLLLSDLQQAGKFQTAYTELKQRLDNEVLQYESNSSRVKEFTSKVQSGAQNDTVREMVKEHLADQSEARRNFDNERAMRRQVLVAERTKQEASRQVKSRLS